jgi:hypothetical protein
VNSARLILVGLICAVPTILLLDGPVIQGLVAATLAGGIAVVAGTMRQGETDFLLSIIRPVAVLAVIPALWMLVQIVPLKSGSGLAHPIWQSAEQALGHPISGSISIDPGATLLAFAQYLWALAVTLMAAAVAVDRERAEWVLFALVAATALVALVIIGHDVVGLTFLSEAAGSTARAQARTCVALGVIVAITAGIRTFERQETGHLRPDRSPKTLKRTFIACAVALALCALALIMDLTASLGFAVAYGVGALLAVVAIRRLGLGFWGCLAIAMAAGVIGVALIATRGGVGTTDLTVAFASGKSDALLSTTQRMLADVPWMGTGAGTFAKLLPIYRDAGDVIANSMAPTTAAKFAIELGRPMLWAIVVTVVVGIFVLLRGALERGRDSFYPAAGASALLLLLLLAFCDNGLLGTPVAICAAALVGLALVQSKSRTVT